MVESGELMCAFITFGRRNLQDFVARSNDVSDVITYLLVERNLELARLTPFKTKDLVTFERKEVFHHHNICKPGDAPK
jgi:hypothetical protein